MNVATYSDPHMIDMLLALTVAFGRAPDVANSDDDFGNSIVYDFGIAYLNAGIHIDDDFCDGAWSVTIHMEERSERVSVRKGASVEAIARTAKRAADRFVATRAA